VLSHREVHRLAGEAARGLISLGIEPRDRVAVLGGTVPEWTLADLAVLAAGAVVIPIYHTNSPEECQYVLSHSGARAVLCEDESQLAKIRAVREACPALEHVIAFGEHAPAEDVVSIAYVRERGAGVDASALADATRDIAASDPATVVYTSGTTGPPKGCVLTHGNMVSTAHMVEDQLVMPDGGRPGVFQFLPLAHVFARVVQFATLAVGGELLFWRGNSKQLLEDLRDTRPTHFPSVPRIFEKVHTAALSGLEEGSAPKRAIFKWALGVGARKRGGLQHALAERLVFSKVKGLFGGNLHLAIVGAAPIGREVLEFFDACGVVVNEGYGMTETCAATTLNTVAARRLGTVGKPLPGIDVRIAGDGEILMRGPNISPGYLNDPEATRQTFGEDGWLHSGDLGEIDEDGFLRITGRKKELIITSSGKNITPANIETMLRETRWISQAIVYGDNKPYLVAALTLDPDEAKALAEHAGVGAASPDELADSEAVHALVREEVDRVNARLANIEQIKRFALLPRDLTQADGELTPTLKVRRAAVYDKYRDRFEELYGR
jgi:long-chain acyl-CoA synthetase